MLHISSFLLLLFALKTVSITYLCNPNHEYGMKTNALALKREYLTEAQMKDYIRQEIFNVTENLVSLCQKNRALHNIRFDILMPDFLWESVFF